MKKNIIAISILFSIIVNAQQGSVGINTEAPKATLHVLGSPADASKFDGIIPPKLTGDELSAKTYTSEQLGAIVYVSEAANIKTGQVLNVAYPDYYYFDGTKWLPLHETLYDVVNRGNFSPKYISFTGDSSTKQGTLDGAVGYNSATKSYYFGALNPLHSGNYNVTMGLNVGSKITTGYSNSIFGTNAGQNITTSYENALFGKDSGNALLTGMWNAGFGEGSLYNITDGLMNTGLGDGAFSYASGRNVYNTGVGANSLRRGGGNKNGNIGLGVQAGYQITGNNNIFIGNGTGYNISDSNKLYIHNNIIIDNGTNGGAGTFKGYVGVNSLIYGDFVDRWLRINGSLILSPSYIKTADSSFDKILSYNTTTGEVGISTASNFGFVPLAGTVSGAPITGDLVVENGNAQGGFSIKTLTENAYLKFLDDGKVEINKNSGSNVNIQGIDFAGVSDVWSSGITGQYYYGANYQVNSYVQKKYVDDKVATVITVPAPPASGNYILKSINGVMTWIAE